ncbi:MAG: hypothetical protein U0V70_08085 [Terriglobia bacterium]
MGNGTQSSVFIAAFLCASWATTILFGKAARALDPSPAVVASLVFAAVVLVAFVAGQYPWFPASPAPLGAQIAGLGLFLFSIGLFLAVGHQIKSLDQLRGITWLFLSTGAVISITSALIPEGTWVQWGRIQSTVGSTLLDLVCGHQFQPSASESTIVSISKIFLVRANGDISLPVSLPILLMGLRLAPANFGGEYYPFFPSPQTGNRVTTFSPFPGSLPCNWFVGHADGA